jgi:hypothetical protein
MSLEAKIETLTAAIVDLTDRLTAIESSPVDSAKTEEDVPATPEQSITREEIQSMCLAIVRDDRNKKTAIKKTLSMFGATLVKDVPVDNLGDLKTELEAL